MSAVGYTTNLQQPHAAYFILLKPAHRKMISISFLAAFQRLPQIGSAGEPKPDYCEAMTVPWGAPENKQQVNVDSIKCMM